MKIIIVAKFLRAPRQLALNDPRLIAGVGLSALLLVALGALAGALIRAPQGGGGLAEIASMREVLARQSEDLVEARAQVDRELNAMAAQMGALQAQSTRLNALGERLTRMAQLDDGEFNFSEPPALGGPESFDDFGTPADRSVRASLEALASRIETQTHQLDLLENLLLDRDVDTALRPAGLPVRAGYASSSFGMRSDPFTAKREFHRGMDFSGPLGSDILAVADGVVAFSGRHPSYGNMVDIDHGNGYMTRYAHNQKNLVEPGQRVRAGDVIARMGRSGRATGVHVHFEVWVTDRPVNPHAYLKRAAPARG
ncbi:MAG: M23 family metallopeptidase [Alphaproteobacteria bacterium]|nr:M23 family metallopeptidase [Alphaproteobacteria bacterium]